MPAAWEAVILPALLFAFEIDGVDRDIRVLRRVEGLVQRLLAPAIHAVRKNHQRLPAVLRLHQLVRREKDGIVELRSTAPAAPLPVAIVSGGLWTLAVVLGARGRAHLVDFMVKFFSRCGEVLQQFDLAIEVDQERLVFGRSRVRDGRRSRRSCSRMTGTRRIGARLVPREHLVHKLVRGLALVFHRSRDATAGVNEQA